MADAAEVLLRRRRMAAARDEAKSVVESATSAQEDMELSARRETVNRAYAAGILNEALFLMTNGEPERPAIDAPTDDSAPPPGPGGPEPPVDGPTGNGPPSVDASTGNDPPPANVPTLDLDLGPPLDPGPEDIYLPPPDAGGRSETEHNFFLD